MVEEETLAEELLNCLAFPAGDVTSISSPPFLHPTPTSSSDRRGMRQGHAQTAMRCVWHISRSPP